MVLRRITNPLLVGKSGLYLTLANSVVNVGAVGISSSLNVYFMRGSEKQKGISVMDPETGEVLGTSKVAASKAIN
jgi:sideroflexin-5